MRRCQRPIRSHGPTSSSSWPTTCAYDGFGAAGNPISQTPAINRLAAQGCRFRNHFVTTSICCVSRASILSGQYARRHGIKDFGQPFSAEAWRQTYPALLHAAGYHVALVGHLGVGKETPPDTFDLTDLHPNLRNFFTPGNPQHRTAHIGDVAVAAVEELSQKQPFCLGVNFSAPHADDGARASFRPTPATSRCIATRSFHALRPPTRHSIGRCLTSSSGRRGGGAGSGASPRPKCSSGP